MSYAEILVAMGDDDLAFERAAYAGTLAGQLGAGIRGVLSRWPRPPEIEPTATIGMVGELLAAARANCRLGLAAVEARFRETVGAVADRVSFAGGTGSMTEAVLREARRADLIVIGQSALPNGDRERCDAQVLLTRSGRPVLVVPTANKTRALPRHIGIAWRDCRASRHVVREAMPLLRRAQQVTVVTSSEDHSPSPASSATDVADFLQGHGVPARAAAQSKPTSLREFLHVLGEGDVDLLVSPAYCTNQLINSELARQTTRMLTGCCIPCLLAT